MEAVPQGGTAPGEGRDMDVASTFKAFARSAASGMSGAPFSAMA